MKHLPFNPGADKITAIVDYKATQVVFPLAKQPPAHLDSVYPPSAFRKGFEFYQAMFKGANLDIRKYPEVHCPLGKKGDALYVQEEWSTIGADLDYILKRLTMPGIFSDRNKSQKWQPPGTMPKKIARIWVAVTDVRLQRVQSISKEQAKAEGPIPMPQYDEPGFTAYVDHLRGGFCFGPSIAFQQGFKAKHGKRAWDKNIWVWVVSFKPMEAPNLGSLNLPQE